MSFRILESNMREHQADMDMDCISNMSSFFRRRIRSMVEANGAQIMWKLCLNDQFS